VSVFWAMEAWKGGVLLYILGGGDRVCGCVCVNCYVRHKIVVHLLFYYFSTLTDSVRVRGRTEETRCSRRG
jgi:hypothetical protein